MRGRMATAVTRHSDAALQPDTRGPDPVQSPLRLAIGPGGPVLGAAAGLRGLQAAAGQLAAVLLGTGWLSAGVTGQLRQQAGPCLSRRETEHGVHRPRRVRLGAGAGPF